MEPRVCATIKTLNYETLRSALSSIMKRMDALEDWNLTEDTRTAVVTELLYQKEEIKHQMHKLIDAL